MKEYKVSVKGSTWVAAESEDEAFEIASLKFYEDQCYDLEVIDSRELKETEEPEDKEI